MDKSLTICDWRLLITDLRFSIILALGGIHRRDEYADEFICPGLYGGQTRLAH